MQIKFEKEKILHQAKHFWLTISGKCYIWAKEKTFALKPFYKEHKEAVIKALVPLMIILVGFYACSLTQKIISKNIVEVFEIADRIREQYLDKPDYWGLSTEYAAKKQLIDPKFIKNDKIVLSSGTEIFIGEGEKAEVIMPLSQNFDISMRGLNKAQCIAYCEAELGQERLLGIIRLTIVNKGGTYIFEWGGENPLPVQKYAAKDFCLDTDNTFIWSIK